MKKRILSIGFVVAMFVGTGFAFTSKNANNLVDDTKTVHGHTAADGFCDPSGTDCAYEELEEVIIK